MKLTLPAVLRPHDGRHVQPSVRSNSRRNDDSVPTPGTHRTPATVILAITTDVWLARLFDRVVHRHRIVSTSVADLDAALPLTRAYRYDAVVVARQRGVDQAEVCARLRDEGVTCPILIVVHGQGVDDVVSGLNAGADGVLVEPVSDGEFVARLHAAHRRFQMTQAASRSVVRMGAPPGGSPAAPAYGAR